MTPNKPIHRTAASELAVPSAHWPSAAGDGRRWASGKRERTLTTQTRRPATRPVQEASEMRDVPELPNAQGDRRVADTVI